MAQDSKISWTDHTFNPWIGCTKVSPGCDNCYAERLATTRMGVPWGVGAPRRLTTASWKNPRKWNRDAAKTGKRPRVFCASLADVFDTEVDPAWRARLWELIRETPNLDWLLLTKRPVKIQSMLPPDWPAGYDHVHLGASVVVPEEVDRNCGALLDVEGGGIRWVSAEPLLGDIAGKLEKWLTPTPGQWTHAAPRQRQSIGWVITGGESGPGARYLPPEWPRRIRDVCNVAGVAFDFKQWGEFNAAGERVGVAAAGELLDGLAYHADPFKVMA